MVELLLFQSAANFAYILIYLLAFLIFIGVVYWLITRFAPEPLRSWAVAVVVVLCAIALIYALLSFAGGGFPHMR